MKHKQLGNTEFKLPEIGLGTLEYRGGTKPLTKGIELGAYFVDTAEGYGTEQVVGRAIRPIRNRIFLATKVSPNHFRRSDVVKAADESLRRLQTDYIDLYQLHYPNYVVPIEETIAAMEHLVEVGKVRWIGVSNFWLRELKHAQSCFTNHRIVSNQVRYSLVDRGIEDGLLQYCLENQITIIAYSPLARGMNNLRRKDVTGVLGQVARETGKTEAQVALNWCIAKSSVVAIPKADSVQHTIENCGASDWKLSPEQISRLERGVRCRSRLELAVRRYVRRVRLTLQYR